MTPSRRKTPLESNGIVSTGMNQNIHRLLLAPILLIVAGCSTPVYYHTDPGRHVVVLDREPVSVLQTGKDQWEAWGGGSAGRPEQRTALFERQIKAIELVSDCQAIHSVVDPDDARKLTTTVKCSDSFDETSLSDSLPAISR